MFKINTGYYLELLKPEKMKLPKSTENKITKDKNGENVLHFQFTDVILSLQWTTMSTMVINKIQEYSIHLLPINYLVIYQKFYHIILLFIFQDS